MGSAALELAYVASGRLDAYIERTINLWDMAAGALLVESAGGEFYALPAPDGKLRDVRRQRQAAEETSDRQSAEINFQFFQRLRAVAQFVFHVFAQFGERFFKSVRHEQRVVAKTVLPARLEKNFAFARAVE